MASATEIKAFIGILQEAVTSKDVAKAVEQLEIIKDKVIPTEELLRETKAGVAVGKLRSHASPEIQTIAKSIVKVWKDAVDEGKKRKAAASGAGDEPASSSQAKKKAKGEKGSAPVSTPTSPSSTNSNTKSTSSQAGNSKTNSSRPIAPLPSKGTSSSTSSSSAYGPSHPSLPTIVSPYPETPRTFKADKPNSPGLGNDVRDRCVELVYDALAGDSNVSKEVLLEKSKAVEKGFYQACSTKTDNTYRSKMRGICLNLKERSNPDLRDAVVRGEIEASKLATMSKEDMASSTLQALNKKLETENLFNSRGAEEIKAETDQFKCGKCHMRKTTYYQMQTRSADEPMTTFVTCLNCNNRWKFS